jgi:hypothetical protein
MVSISRQDVTIGTIISATSETVRVNARPILFFVALFTVVGTLVDYAEQSGNLASEFIVVLWYFSIAVASVIAIYFLVEAMLRQAALMDHFGSRRILPYVGQAIVMGFGIVVGFVLLIIPGLILLARWSLAPALLIGKGMGAIDAMQRSWELTRGHTVAIVIAAILLFGIAFLGSAIIYALFGEESVAALFVAQVLQNGVSAVSAALGVALLNLLDDSPGQFDEVFA